MEKDLTITKVAKACGVSRMTLRRLCDRGLLGTSNDAAPGEIKRYGCNDIMRLERILSLQRCGVTQKEMEEFFKNGGDSSLIYQKIEERYRLLQGLMSELKLYMRTEAGIVSVVEEEVPPTAFFVKKKRIKTTYENVIEFLQESFMEAVDRGYQLRLVPALALMRGFDHLSFRDHAGEELEYSACIALESWEEDDENVIIVPGGTSLSLLWYGKMKDEDQFIKMLISEVEKRGYRPDGFIMTLLICDSQLEFSLSEDKAFVKFMIPVAK